MKRLLRQAAALFQAFKRLKEWFDSTQKTTLTAFFHTILPSGVLHRKMYQQCPFSPGLAELTEGEDVKSRFPGGFRIDVPAEGVI
ncbi:hypothetical protein [uncultured Pseudoflavonifractor sp.]|uniref:hypothetical protein n=1 Tax=uncultured Pseudoflavonifractor sp. TaxID=1221379 RepID=UPI0025F66F8E|nr:hypothetical protein [uncultured Pseudoflavonifractor sp.]